MLFRATSRLLSSQSARVAAVRGYADGAMPLTFASQSQVFYNEQDVKQIDVPSFSGSFGILPSHVPSLAVLKPGVITVYESDGDSKKYFVSSGVVSINEDATVQILAEEAAKLGDIDLSAAKEVLSSSKQELSSASSEQSIAEAQIAVEVAEALVKAAETGA